MKRIAIVLSCSALLWGQAAAADLLEGLAPPGPCAEERAELRGAPVSGFDVSGSPILHFDPLDVAAGPGDGFVPPEAPSFMRTACDAPTASCSPSVPATVIGEPGPDPGDGPVFGKGQP